MLEDDDPARALIRYVSDAEIKSLVLGSISANSFMRYNELLFLLVKMCYFSISCFERNCAYCRLVEGYYIHVLAKSTSLLVPSNGSSTFCVLLICYNVLSHCCQTWLNYPLF